MVRMERELFGDDYGDAILGMLIDGARAFRESSNQSKINKLMLRTIKCYVKETKGLFVCDPDSVQSYIKIVAGMAISIRTADLFLLGKANTGEVYTKEELIEIVQSHYQDADWCCRKLTESRCEGLWKEVVENDVRALLFFIRKNVAFRFKPKCRDPFVKGSMGYNDGVIGTVGKHKHVNLSDGTNDSVFCCDRSLEVISQLYLTPMFLYLDLLKR